jgi:hypothetical protein
MRVPGRGPRLWATRKSGCDRIRVGGETGASIRLGSIALEHQHLICPHLCYVEPAVLWIERHRVGLSNPLWIDKLGGNELLGLDGASVTGGEPMGQLSKLRGDRINPPPGYERV